MVTPETDRPGQDGEPEELGQRDRFDDARDDETAPERNPGPAPSDPDEDFRSDELALGDDNVSLPWLDGDDDLEDERGGSGQILLLALLAMVALALIVGGIWWFSRGDEKGDLLADGSLIEAPDAPYKEKPENPGGKNFEGTGDTSFAVSEGKTRPAMLGDDAEPPRPGFESLPAPAVQPSRITGSSGIAKAPKAGPAAAGVASPSPAVVPASGPAVQVGAYSSRALAEDAWERLAESHSALSGVRYRVVEGRADFGTVFRLQALPGDAAAARSLCGRLKADGQDCTVKN